MWHILEKIYVGSKIFERYKLFALLACQMIICAPIYAQRPTSFGQGGGNRPNQQTTTTQDTGPDTTIYEYILIDNIYKKTPLSDTLADISFMHNNMLIRNNVQSVHTGNFGSAAYPLTYRPKIFSGFASGYNQYDNYQLKLNTFRFYEQNRPISDLYFSQLTSQENINVRANFSRNFSKGLSVSVNYLRISQKGFYTGQDTKSTSFGIGLRYKSSSERYNAMLLFIHNATEEGHIGNIISENDLLIRFKKDIPVVLSQAATRQQERNVAFVQYLKLSDAKKSDFRLYIKNYTEYKPSYYKFYDNNINDSNDTLFYNVNNTDKRGLRRYLSINHLSNSFYINGEKSNGLNGKLGLVMDLFYIKDGTEPNNRFDLTGVFDGIVPVFRTLQLETKGKLGLAKNIGNFDFSGRLNIKISKLGSLSGFLRFFRSENPYNVNRLVINDIVEKENSFSKPVGTEFGGDLVIPSLRIKAGLSQTIVNKPIYWSVDGMATQSDGIFTSTYVKFEHILRIGHFNLNNHLHLQIFNTNLYPLPKYYSTHQLYYSGSWFKKVMDVSLGLDVRLIPDYNGPGFQPLYGEFHLTNSALPFFPASNLFFLARVSSFRAMIMMENFSQYFVTNTNFDVFGNPQFDPKLRFGFQWLLKD